MGLRRELLVVGVCAVAACGDSAPGRTFFDRNIQPILEQKCVGNTSGCHSVNEGDVFQIAAGNLDVTSFENIQKRRDTLSPFGAYPFPLFLIKSVGAGTLKMQYGASFVSIDVQHSGGAILEVGSDAYFTLQNWLENGATENGLKPASPPREGEGECSTQIPAGFDRTKYITAASQPRFAEFKTTVQPILASHGCTAGNCHGAPQSDFYITCGSSEEQLEFNFSQAWSFVNTPVDDSQLLRVPLAVGRGGRGHTGGDQFAGDDNDADYKALRAWAEAVGKLDFAGSDPGKQFFAANVQRVLLTRGCGFQACHSPQAGNDFKMRSGSIGFFSAVALEKNYELVRQEFMALEFADARRSRVVAKTILEDDARVTGVGGIAHRGGPVLETSGGGATGGADPATCGAFNPATASAFCTVQEWLRIERAALAGQVTSMGSGDPVDIVYVERPDAAPAGRLEFDTFQGGADLMLASTTFGAGGSITPTGTAVSILTSCNLGTNPDVQAPDVANDGNRIAFAARRDAAAPLGIYVVDINGNNCTRITPPVADVNGLKIHNFDPAWSPDGSHIVFASTRGKAGPTRSRKRMLPQSDLWRVKVNGFTADPAPPEQMTFLSNSELGPQFMREGRVTMTTEKVSAGFYQLAGRRINWDLTDYHPLLGQRKDSVFADPADPAATRPSIGYGAVTDIREGSDGNFLIILSNTNAAGAPSTPAAAGALAVFNRSVGP
ncbi:MAG: PD40 domain-containing protein, partial [Deltaproteobacteria bacterium]|nr:PD40 domain-containing protein [Deltaproteobacteria bacterium]